ncbi:ArnT family glycosyltransferase [Halocatena salina]|uniref:Glycosyltransferase family 39 protein n=1 Tax=Halocatena salina TaxID=2934340 RepID=A0A8U0A892_9EURY|nr:glycosyltransferase family 39 protein [Halocatena salina]UPM45194.1 glycosyltransferase family 39 protein [Halocatena salina]
MSDSSPIHSPFDSVSSLFEESFLERLVLGGILCLSAILTLFRLPSEGYGNLYYAAAVKNMLRSSENFFFVAFDAGYVTVDKPPLGLWIQTASAGLFGFNGWSMILPQAIACVLSVALVYVLVGRTFGSWAGVVAALTMALTPIVIPTSRNNTTDMLVVLAVLAGAYFLLRAAETGRRRWLFASMTAVGLGFNIKMMQAYLVLPAFYLVYLLASRMSVRRRFMDLVLATGVLSVISFAWATIVALIPAAQRPFIGSTDTNSIFSLIVGYNGIQRLLGINRGMTSGGSGGGGMAGGGFSHGAAGPLRLFNQQLAGQISWLIPLALIGLLIAGYRYRDRWPLDAQSRSVVLWGTWFLTAATFFSVAGFFHRYYLVMLAPAVAALVGIGLTELWDMYRTSGPQGWLLPGALLVTASVQAYILLDYPTFAGVLQPVVLGGTILATAVLVVARVREESHRGVAKGAVVVALIILLVAPTIWGAFSIVSGSNVTIPSAGPMTMDTGGSAPSGGPSSGQFGGGAPQLNGSGGASSSVPAMAGGMSGAGPATSDTQTSDALTSYLEANQGNATYLAAVDGSAMTAAPIMLATDEPVISLGGFSGSDPVMNSSELATLVAQGDVRYVVTSERPMGGLSGGTNDFMANRTGGSPPSGGMGSMFDGGQQSETTEWVENSCRSVPNDQWQSGTSNDSTITSYTLYDCSSAVSS